MDNYALLHKKHKVEKRNVLNEMWAVGMTLQSLRFFSIYLSKINSRDPKTRVVRFSVKDFMKIMEYTGNLNRAHYEATIDRLLGYVVHMPIESGGLESFQLFKKCRLDQDQYGEWCVEINAHDDALPLMFEFKNRYFTYELWNALRVKSINQLRMYEILKQYQNKGERKLPLSELRSLIGIAPDEYKRWDRFKVSVLDRCQTALAEYTDIKYTYETIRNGRGGKVTGILFKIEKNENYIDQITLDEFIDLQEIKGQFITVASENTNLADELTDDDSPEERYDKHLQDIAEACDYEFTNIEMQMISTVMGNIPRSERYEFIRNQYLKLLRRAENKTDPLKNRFKYILKITENEVVNNENN